MHPTTLHAVFQVGTAPLTLPTSELIAIRNLIPARPFSHQALVSLLNRLKLTDTGLADALFALSDFSNIGSVRPKDFITTYATLRHLALERENSNRTALCLAFLSAGGGAENISWSQWLKLAGELGLGVGGVDSLPSEEVMIVLRRRWSTKSARWRRVLSAGNLNHPMPFNRFVELMNAGDAGLIEGLRAMGFVLMHAVLSHSDVPVEKPVWRGDAESCSLSQYMTFAIMQVSSIESKTSTGEIQTTTSVENGRGSLESAEARTDVTKSSSTDEDSQSLPKFESPSSSRGRSKPTLHINPFPDVEKIESSPRTSLILPEADARQRPKLPPVPRGVVKGDGRSTVRRTRDAKGNSPFHIDFSSLTLGEKIGSGGYGDVYQGTFLMSPVAVKMFHINVRGSLSHIPESMLGGSTEDEDPSVMNRKASMSVLQRFASVNSLAKYKNFVREVEMMSVVRHPNLVLYMGACGDPVTPLCIVSELFTGGSLYEYLHGSDEFRPSVKASTTFCLNIARGMYYLHSSEPSILHRDLKSRNVLLSGRKASDEIPHAVICDFGLCQLFGEEGHSTGSGASAMGTASYMSPDVISGENHEASDDVYSFGVLMHEIFTGSVPYSGMRAMQVMFRVAHEEMRPESDRDGDIPEDMKTLMAACWDRARTERPTFAQIIQRLEEFEELVNR